MALKDIKGIADAWEKNRRSLKLYGDEFKKLGLAEKDASTLAKKAAKLDEDALKKKTEGLKKVGDVLGQVRAMGTEAFAGISGAVGALTHGDVKGTLDGIVDSVAALAKGLDLVYPGLGQAAAALVKFAGGGAGLMYELAARTIDENQKVAELRNTFDALGSNIGNTGDEMRGFFDYLSSELPQTRVQLAKMSEPLLEAGYQGDQLEKKLRAQSAAMAMLGERGGQAYTSLAERARVAQRNYQPLTVTLQDILKTGVNTKDLADQMGVSQERLNQQIRFGAFNAKFFGDALDEAITKKGAKASKTLSGMLGSILPKMSESIGMLFQFSEKESGSLDKFGKSLSDFGTIFDESTASGQTLHNTLHDLIDNVLKGATAVLTGARIGFKMLEVVWHQVRHAALPLRKAIKPLGEQIKKLGDSLGGQETAMKVFTNYLKAIGIAAGYAAREMATMIGFASKLLAIANSIGGAKGQGGSRTKLADMILGGVGGTLPGHADGGVVTGIHGGLATVRAAPGEGLASIGRGERIVPANGGESKGGLVVHVAPGAVQIHGSQGQSSIELTEEALSLVFERVMLRRGFA